MGIITELPGVHVKIHSNLSHGTEQSLITPRLGGM